MQHQKLSFDHPNFTHDIINTDRAWVIEQIRSLIDSKIKATVSEWAEATRYLPATVTSMPGYYSYNVAPYLREISDCMSVDSIVREVDVMKGAQIGATVGILENTIGYIIDHVKEAPVMLLTADSELAQLRIDSYIIPMIQHSGLDSLIQTADTISRGKTGKTKKRIEWQGGGFLIPAGAKNADKLRSVSIRYLLEDECDSFPDSVGRDGDPQKLAEARTKAYHESRKILRVSTPLYKSSSKIRRGFLRGDQRYYYVPCRSCEKMQTFRFEGFNDETGERYGLVWTTTDGILDEHSVKYICRHCGHRHIDADKSWMLPKGAWRATAKSRDQAHRSYHISALYSPVGMFNWTAVVRAWLDCWDQDNQRFIDHGLAQEFYNNVLGEAFEIVSSKVEKRHVSNHRRTEYNFGTIPNVYAEQNSHSKILLVTCQVDVHAKNLAVAVMGWTKHACCYLIDYWRFEVADKDDYECNELSSSVWERLRELIETKEYVADDGSTYKISLTLIDSGYANDTVCTFCSDYDVGVLPILGRDRTAKYQKIKEFGEFRTSAGRLGYRVLVDHYKDRLAPVLRRDWMSSTGVQRQYHFNAPINTTDKMLNELTVEYRSEKRDSRGRVSYPWHRPGNARNELWDLLVYGHAAVEIIAYNLCIQQFELETVNWDQFWEYIEQEKTYFSS